LRELISAREAEKRWRYSSVDSSVVGCSPGSNDVNTVAEEISFVESCYQATASDNIAGSRRVSV
jgi:hypothetical protein